MFWDDDEDFQDRGALVGFVACGLAMTFVRSLYFCALQEGFPFLPYGAIVSIGLAQTCLPYLEYRSLLYGSDRSRRYCDEGLVGYCFGAYLLFVVAALCVWDQGFWLLLSICWGLAYLAVWLYFARPMWRFSVAEWAHVRDHGPASAVERTWRVGRQRGWKGRVTGGRLERVRVDTREIEKIRMREQEEERRERESIENARRKAEAEERERAEQEAARKREIAEERERLRRERRAEEERLRKEEEEKARLEDERRRAEDERKRREEESRDKRERAEIREAMRLFHLDCEPPIVHLFTEDELEDYLTRHMYDRCPIGSVRLAAESLKDSLERHVAQEKVRVAYAQYAGIIGDRFSETKLNAYLDDSMGDDRSLADVKAAGEKLIDRLRRMYSQSPLHAIRAMEEAERLEVDRMRDAGMSEEMIEEELAARKSSNGG